MRLLGIGLGQVVTIVRETRMIESTPGHLSVAGPGARELADALAEGGDASAVVVEGDPVAAAVAIRIVSGPVTQDERALLRRAVRAGTPLLVVRHGADSVPYVLPQDVLDGEELPIETLAAAIARLAPDAAPALAARLPVLRCAIERRLISVTSWGNALIAASSRSGAAHLPLLSISQSRMLLLLATGRGHRLPSDPKAIASAAGPPIVASIAVGLAARELVRRAPVGGPAVRAAVAYAGTRALGAARLRLP
jgi:hypothetical protein